MELATSRQK